MVGLDSGKAEDSAVVVSTIQGTGDSVDVEEEFFGDCFLLSGVVADGWCPPMPTGLSPPEHGQVAGVQSSGVRHMHCSPDGSWSAGPIESHGKVQLSVTL